MSEVEDTVTTIKDSISNIKEKSKNEDELLMKIQLSDSKQISEQAVPMVKAEGNGVSTCNKDPARKIDESDLDSIRQKTWNFT